MIKSMYKCVHSRKKHFKKNWFSKHFFSTFQFGKGSCQNCLLIYPSTSFHVWEGPKSSTTRTLVLCLISHQSLSILCTQVTEVPIWDALTIEIYFSHSRNLEKNSIKVQRTEGSNSNNWNCVFFPLFSLTCEFDCSCSRILHPHEASG